MKVQHVIKIPTDGRVSELGQTIENHVLKRFALLHTYTTYIVHTHTRNYIHYVLIKYIHIYI